MLAEAACLYWVIFSLICLARSSMSAVPLSAFDEGGIWGSLRCCLRGVEGVEEGLLRPPWIGEFGKLEESKPDVGGGSMWRPLYCLSYSISPRTSDLLRRWFESDCEPSTDRRLGDRDLRGSEYSYTLGGESVLERCSRSPRRGGEFLGELLSKR